MITPISAPSEDWALKESIGICHTPIPKSAYNIEENKALDSQERMNLVVTFRIEELRTCDTIENEVSRVGTEENRKHNVAESSVSPSATR